MFQSHFLYFTNHVPIHLNRFNYRLSQLNQISFPKYIIPGICHYFKIGPEKDLKFDNEHHHTIHLTDMQEIIIHEILGSQVLLFVII
jgi:hypothetical protein